MGPADLHDVVPFHRLCSDGITQRRHCWDKAALGLDRCRDVHCGREAVIRGLRHVDVIVWMNRTLAAKRRARELAAAVRDDLVDVHIELSTAAGHPDMQRKHVVVPPGKDLVADSCDQFMSLAADAASGMVCGCRRSLQDGVSGDHLSRHQIVPDAEVLKGPLGL